MKFNLLIALLVMRSYSLASQLEHKDCMVKWTNVSAIFTGETKATTIIRENLRQKGYKVTYGGWSVRHMPELEEIYSVVSTNFIGRGTDCYSVDRFFGDELFCTISFKLYYLDGQKNLLELAVINETIEKVADKDKNYKGFYNRIRKSLDRIPVCKKN